MTAKKDLTGMKFGRLTVEEEAPKGAKGRQWLCACSCGGTKVCRQDRLTSGSNTSCGCAEHEKRERVAMVGRTFNGVFCSRFVESKRIGGQNRRIYAFVCACGTEFVADGAKVRYGQIKTCGCGKLKRGKAALEAAHKRFYEKNSVDTSNQWAWLGALKNGAKRRGVAVSCSNEYLLSLAVAPCAYCGEAPTVRNIAKRRAESKARRRGDTTNSKYFDAATWAAHGIDRVDSSKGYDEGNCVPCCTKCNIMKLDHTQEDFLLQVKRIYAHMKLGREEVE